MITGIDIGIKYTGVSTIDNKGAPLFHTCFGSKVNAILNKKEVTKHTAKRWVLYAEFMHDYFTEHSITGTVVIEAPFNLSGDANKLLELKGIYIIVAAEYCDTSKIYLLPPTTIKRIFTGSGAASKEQIILECKKRGYNPPNDNYADAYAAAYTAIIGNIHDFT